MGNVTRRVGIVAAALMVAAGCGVTQSSAPATPPASTPAASPSPTPANGAMALEDTYEQVIANVLPSIVQITTKTGLGSGVVYDTGGHIITNAHVVGQAETFEVTPATGGSPRNAKLVKSFPDGDLAVIKVDDPAKLVPAKFGDSAKLRVGQMVLAMGNPLGLSGSVTNGIVSALGRTVTEPAEAGSPEATIVDAVQTSAAINPGNSGGALVNLSGEVIGIPTLVAADPQAGAAATGIGFAIPSNTATDIARQIVTSGKVTNTRRAALGITASVVVGPDGQPAGVNVIRVTPGEGADKAGIEPGDVIVAVNGEETPTTSALTEVLASQRPGDKAKVEVLHPDGTTTTVTATLSELPGS
ncbi:trypsin-like peptidase domain-containing protein [Streptosporangium soli]|nr:trypsin-like peptidase domain-containing protein [Streptosporangium sp. KLBMP 9127]